MRTNVALAAGICLGLTAGAALAQNPTYEGRGYGGPLYVGPNFQTGGQHTAPTYGKKPVKKSVAVPTQRPAAKVQKAKPEKKEVATKKAAPQTVKEEPATPAVAEKPAAADATAAETAATTPATCKRFEPTSGQTITVPCQ
jgi:hypothetical protein